MKKALGHLVSMLITLNLLRNGGCQVVTIDVIEPDTQDRLCPNHLVQYECQISVPTSFLQWEHPNVSMGLLQFTGLSSVDSSVSTPDGKFNATLIKREQEGDDVRLISSLTIQPPLNDLNGTQLVCQGFTTDQVENNITIALNGDPDSPVNLSQIVLNTTKLSVEILSVAIQWQAPLYTGGGEDISVTKYNVTANGRTTVVMKDVSDIFNLTITGLDYNTDYDVKVTAINSCGLGSKPSTVLVNIGAQAEGGGRGSGLPTSTIAGVVVAVVIIAIIIIYLFSGVSVVLVNCLCRKRPNQDLSSSSPTSVSSGHQHNTSNDMRLQAVSTSDKGPNDPTPSQEGSKVPLMPPPKAYKEQQDRLKEAKSKALMDQVNNTLKPLEKDSHHSSESDQHQLLTDPAPDDRGVHNPMLDNEHAAGNIEGGGQLKEEDN